jgi:hypothetical protein
MAACESAIHEAVLAELIEWWEDVADPARSVGSQVVVVRLPHGWGRSTVLLRLCGHVRVDDVVMGRAFWLRGVDAPVERAEQVVWLKGRAEEAELLGDLHPMLGVDSPAGAADRGLDVASVFTGTLVPPVAFLLATVGLGMAAYERGRTPDGLAAQAGRVGAAIARFSVGVPVLVAIDDADDLDSDLVFNMITEMVDRVGAQVLVVAVVDPGGSPLAERLDAAGRSGLLDGRVAVVEGLETEMGLVERQRLVDQVAPSWPDAARLHLAIRAGCYADVLATVTHPGAQELESLAPADASRRVDALLADSVPARSDRSSLAEAVMAWAGGVLHSDQLDAALARLDHPPGPGAGVVVDEPQQPRLLDGEGG